MNKSQTKFEQFVHEQVMSKSKTIHEQLMNKSQTSCEEVINNSWTSHKQSVNKLCMNKFRNPDLFLLDLF